MSDPQHTPLPWRLATHSSTIVLIPAEGSPELTLPVCSMTDLGVYPHRENAELIVRAVNSHAKLVALLTSAKLYVKLGMANSTKSTAAARGTAAKDLRDIEAALAEARGESHANG